MNKMLMDEEYQIIAKKILYNFCNTPLAEHIFNDPTKFGIVVNAVMTADWEWNGRGTIYGYRKQRVKWVVYKLIKEMSKSENIITATPFSEFGHDDFYDQKQKDFVAEVEENDYIEYVQKKITASTTLSDNEKEVLTGKILQGKTVREISEELGVRGEAVRQTLKRAVTKIGESLCIS